MVQAAVAARDAQHRPYWLIGGGLAVALYSAGSVTARSQSEYTAGIVYGFDLYSPLLLLWVAAGVTEWTLTIGGVKSRELRRSISLMLCLGIAELCQRGTSPGEQLAAATTTQADLPVLRWEQVYWPTFGLATLFILRAVVNFLAPDFFDRRRWRKRGLIAVLLLAVIVFTLYCQDRLAGASSRQWVGWACIVVVALAIVWVSRRAFVADEFFTNHEGTLVRWVLALAFATLVTLSVELYFVRVLPAQWNLLATTVAALVMVEITSEGPLRGVRTRAALWGNSSMVRMAFRHVGDFAARVGKWVSESYRKLGTLGLLWRTAIATLACALFFVVLDEFDNRGRTVVQAFEVYGKDADADAGRRLAELVVHRLNGVTLDLDDNMLVALPAVLRETSSSPTKPMRQAAFHTSELIADLGSNTLDLGPLGKVPLGRILKPLQAPIRRLLNARYIEGAVIRDGNGYRLLAHSSSGQSWTDPRRQEPPAELSALAERLSFSILSTEPNWKQRGMTLHQEAFDEFLSGADQLQQRERLAGNRGTLAATADAIQHLRKAVAVDPSFAVAHYRLALALQDEEQYGGALDHLRVAVAQRPDFGTAQDTMAMLLQQGLEPTPPLVLRAQKKRRGADVPPRTPTETPPNLRREAQKRWTSMITRNSLQWSSKDRAAAHMGLCSLAALAPPDQRREVVGEAKFNCTVAAELYAALPADQLAARDRDALLARASNALGVVRLGARDRAYAATGEKGPRGCGAWLFDTDQSDDAGPSWRLPTRGDPEATRHFFRAHELAPDDSVVACNLAIAQHAESGSTVLLNSLQKDQPTLTSLCEGMLEVAVEQPSSRTFRATLDACDRALTSDPLNVDALNRYAYAYRLWWYMLPDLDKEEQYTGELADRAESRARLAVQLAHKSAGEGVLANVKSTLGEVLLARGRPHEALRWLEEAAQGLPEHVGYSEIRRDLVEAYVCAAREDTLRGKELHGTACRDGANKTQRVLKEIRALESERESRVYTAGVDPLDIHLLEDLCQSAILAPRPLPAARLLAAIAHYPDDESSCGTRVLRVSSPERPDAIVHVWGNGVMVKRKAQHFQLDLDPAAAHGQYFVQLRDGDARALSPRYTIDARAAASTACESSEGAVRVEFASPSVLAAPKPARGPKRTARATVGAQASLTRIAAARSPQRP